MLQNISWSQYFTTLLIATVIYYLSVWLVVFKGRLGLLPGLSNLQPVSLHAEDGPDEVITTAQHVIDELRPLFVHDANKNELLYSLQLRLSKYNQWNEQGFRDTINQFILSECQRKCSIRLEEEDQRALWK